MAGRAFSILLAYQRACEKNVDALDHYDQQLSDETPAFCFYLADLPLVIRLSETSYVYTFNASQITKIPFAPKGVIGVISVHGRIAVAIQLSRILSTQKDTDKALRMHSSRIIFFELDEELYGLVVPYNVKLMQLNKTFYDSSATPSENGDDFFDGGYQQLGECWYVLSLREILNKVFLHDEVLLA